MVVPLGQQYNIGEKATVMLYTYIINRHTGIPPDKTKQKYCSTQLNRLIIIYDNSFIDPCLITIRAYNLERKERYYIVSGEEKYIIYVLQQVCRDFLPCHLIKYMFVFPSTCLTLLFHRLQRQNLFVAFKRVHRW